MLTLIDNVMHVFVEDSYLRTQACCAHGQKAHGPLNMACSIYMVGTIDRRGQQNALPVLVTLVGYTTGIEAYRSAGFN